MNKFDQILKEAKKHFVNARGSHDFDHVERVLKMALHIGKKEKADLEVLKLAAILHDVSRKSADEQKGKVDHAKQGALTAREILEKFKIKESQIVAICHCIEAHRFRNAVKPKTLEAKILFDADKLDSIGAIGVGRAFLFAGEIGAKLHNAVETDVNKTAEFSAEDTAYREFMVKLKYIKSRMQTREGCRIAKSRHDFMVDFFKRLTKEMTGRV